MIAAPGGASVSEIVEALGVGERTVRRYLRALENQGSPVYEERDPGDRRVKRFRLHESARREAVRLTQAQIVSLFLVRRAAGFLRGTGFAEDLDDVFEKLEATLRRKDVVEARHLDRKLYDVNEEAYRFDGRTEDVGELVTGLLREERLEVCHTTVAKGRRRFLVDPYTLLVYRKGLYVVGWSHHHGAIRTFGFDGFRSIAWKRGDRFAYPEKYHPEERLKGAFGITTGGRPTLVRVRFDASVARYVTRRRWHPSQTIQRLAGGGIELRLRVAPSFEVRNWILRFGSTAEVLEPEALRAEVAREVAAMAAVYAGAAAKPDRSA